MKSKYPFLGAGWAFPPRFINQGAEVEMVSEVEDVHQSIRIILSTGLGERTVYDDFGCALSRYLFEEINQRLINGLKRSIYQAILRYEPRVKLDQLEVSTDPNVDGLIQIRLFYTIKATNSRYNMVYPYFVWDAKYG